MSIKKENVQSNVTKETLFVGVGGIGSDIVRRVAERCRGTELDNIKFVVMDTNANDLRWIKNSKASITPIQTSSTQMVLDYLKNDDDARNNWFPNNTILYPKTVSEGAGQVRAVSRLALNATIKTGRIQDLYKAIDELFLKDGGEFKQALRVVVVSSAAGGTGSGIAMIVGMLIREYLHKHYRERAAIIRGYLLLPGVMDTVIRTETEKESLRRNGYATIKEINAFMIKSSGFCGVRKDLERYKDLFVDVPTTTDGVDKLEGLPFDFCFLLDRVDKSQESMQTLEQYKDFAAQSLYEQNIGAMEKDAFSTEDNVIKDFANGDNLGRNRFGGIGASILKYPYEDILEYVAYSRAVSCIGDGETVGEWLKYDKAFEKEKAEFKKRRAYTTEPAPERSEVYVKRVNDGMARFDIDIKGNMANEVEKVQAEVNAKIVAFMTAFDSRIREAFESNPQIKNLKVNVEKLGDEQDYENDEALRGKATTNLQTIRNYESEIKKNAALSARSAARSILFDAPSIVSDTRPFHVEKLLIGNDGAMHPNAMRYMLYLLKDKFADAYKTAKANANKYFNDLSIYSPSANNPDIFDVRGGFTSKSTEINFDAVCNLEKRDASFFEKIGGYKALWNKFNELFPTYADTVKSYCACTLKEASYEVAKEYLKQLCEEFEKFYASFEEKVYLLEKAKDEITDKLKFREGNSVSYVCADKKCLNRWTEVCPTSGEDLMLPSDLNAKIFDTIKINAENARIAVYDSNLAKPPIDIFDTVLIDHFKEKVATDCDGILNINIISAILKELEFSEYFKAVEQASDDSPIFATEISDLRKVEYLRSRIKLGNKLASPGIGCSNFSEPREILLCAYNKKLDDLRGYSVQSLVQPFKISATGTNTVSKYEMRFFNALYNITPDMLSRFKSPDECNNDAQYNEEAGIYFQAYHEHIKNIGPDSTKSSTISLHIDKRWDSLTEMPELSMYTHYKEMLKMHSALVYGVVHGMIIKHSSSGYDPQKRIFALEDAEGDRTSLIVSNNTECDEFYEVLDALYRDRASVEKIYTMQQERCQYDIDSNRRYAESAFSNDLATFKIGDGHVAPIAEAPTSIFEIPLMYYNSLPRFKLDDNELSIMIDSVISVMEKEVCKYEKEADRDPCLADDLEKQFILFVDNFQKCDALRKNTTITDNFVVNMVFRKVSNKLKKLNTFKFDEKIKELRQLIK